MDFMGTKREKILDFSPMRGGEAVSAKLHRHAAERHAQERGCISSSCQTAFLPLAPSYSTFFHVLSGLKTFMAWAAFSVFLPRSF